MDTQQQKFKPGFIGYHKATFKRCVTKHPSAGGKMIVVTTSDGDDIVVAPEQLWTEQEWEARNANLIASLPKTPDFEI